MNAKEYVFGSVALQSVGADIGRALLRFGAGIALMLNHGLGKMPPSDGFIERVGEMGFPIPGLFAWLASFAEVGAALLVAVGLVSRPAALYVTLHMCVVFFMAHAGDPFGRREGPLLFLVIFLFFAFAGGGRFSLDRLINGRSCLTTQI